MSKINILHLRSSGGFFGAEGVILNLTKELNKTGLNNYIVCLNNLKQPHLELLDEAKKIGLKAESVLCRGRLDLKTILAIRSLLKKYSIDILHCHDYKTNFFGFFAVQGLKVTIVTTNHLWTKATRALRFYEALDGFVIRFFSKVIAVSDAIKKEILERGVPEGKVVTINNGIDVEQYRNNPDTQSLRKEFGIDPFAPVVGTVGRLSVEKGISCLLDAAQQVLKVLADVKFLIVGDGPLREELKNKARALGIEKNVIFTGLRRDIADIYSLINLFVLSSFREGLPLVILEALGMGKAVIATNAGGVSSLIQDGKTGILLQPGDVQGLAQAIVNLLKDKQKAEILARNGQDLVKQRFSTKVMASKYTQLYQGLLNK